MAWGTIRRATDKDTEALRIAAERFCKRHGIETHDGFGPESAIDCALCPGYGASDYEHDQVKRLRPLWARIVRRALNSPNAEGIAYGYVGYHVE